MSYWQRYEEKFRDVYWVAHFMSFLVFSVALLGSFGVRFQDLRDVSLLLSLTAFVSISCFLALILAYVNARIIDPALLVDRKPRRIDIVYIAVFAASFLALVAACRAAGTAFDFLFVLPVGICAWIFGARVGQILAVAGGLGLMLVDLVAGGSGNVSSEVGLTRLTLFLIMAYLIGKISDSNHMLFTEVVESEQTKKAVLESMPLAVLTCDRDGKITFTNSKFKALTGELATQDTKTGQTDAQSFSIRAEEEFWSLLGTGEQTVGREVNNVEVRINNKWVLVNKVPLKSANETHLGWVITLCDITDKKEVESQLRQSAVSSALCQVAASLAHEIRNPLTSIRGFVQLVAEKDDQVRLGEVRSYLDVAITEIDRLAQLVSDFLSLAKPGEQNLTLFSLNDLVEELWELVTIKALYKNVAVTKRLAPDLPAIRGEKEQLKQLILHLVDNAVAAVQTRGQVRVETCVNRKREVCLQVEDSGGGIPDSIKDAIFLPFFTTRKDGRGMGLAICHRIVSEHRGSINVESGVRGTTFTVCFPPADMQVPHSPTVVELDSFLSRKQRRA